MGPVGANHTDFGTIDLPQTDGPGSMALIVGGMVAVTVAGFAVWMVVRKEKE